MDEENRKRKKTGWYVRIVRDETGEVASEMGPYASERHADRVAAGASINLDHDRWSAVVSEVTP